MGEKRERATDVDRIATCLKQSRQGMTVTYVGTLETNRHFYRTLNKINFIKGQIVKLWTIGKN